MRRSALTLPDHRYVPGRTARHAEGAFDAARDLAPDPTTSDGAAANVAWAFGLDLLEAGFWWEAHEVLEPVWMNAPPGSAERLMVQAVIQLANAALKHEMGRPRAAFRLCGIVDHLLDAAAADGGGPVMDLAPDELRRAVESLRQRIEVGETGTVRLG